MKTVVLLLLISCAGAIPCKAQLAAEWLSQKKTQKKYLLAQIGALQTYIGWLKQGYKIVNGGLSTIGKIKNGDLDLHTTFLSALKRVSPGLRKNQKVLDLATAQLSLYRYCKNVRHELRALNALPDGQIAAADRLYDRFISELADDALAFAEIITDGRLEMNDSERLRRIEQLYANLLSKRSFIQKVSAELLLYAHGAVRLQDDLLYYQKMIQP